MTYIELYLSGDVESSLLDDSFNSLGIRLIESDEENNSKRTCDFARRASTN
jgi:hypothetical protein